MTASGNSLLTTLTALITRFISSSGVISPAPGRDDHPPISRKSAPSSSIIPAFSIISPSDSARLPLKNESGVTLIIPITLGTERSISLPFTFIFCGLAAITCSLRLLNYDFFPSARCTGLLSSPVDNGPLLPKGGSHPEMGQIN